MFKLFGKKRKEEANLADLEKYITDAKSDPTDVDKVRKAVEAYGDVCQKFCRQLDSLNQIRF